MFCGTFYKKVALFLCPLSLLSRVTFDRLQIEPYTVGGKRKNKGKKRIRWGCLFRESVML